MAGAADSDLTPAILLLDDASGAVSLGSDRSGSAAALATICTPYLLISNMISLPTPAALRPGAATGRHGGRVEQFHFCTPA
jgi:hypothetical protein